jgi:tetratricopeptide (TPR) repeat protein
VLLFNVLLAPGRAGGPPAVSRRRRAHGTARRRFPFPAAYGYSADVSARRRERRAAARLAPARPHPRPNAAGPAAADTTFARLLAAPWSLPAVLALAAALRLAHLMAISGSPFATALQLDHRFYDEWGQRIAAGQLIGTTPFFVDPLYAYVLGGVYAVFGHSLLVVRLLQIALGVATCWLAARLARRTWDDAAVATLAALLLAIFIPALHYEAAIEKTTLGVFLLALALDRYLAGTTGAALAAGVALGCGVLARGTFLILVPAGALGLIDWRAVRASLPRTGAFLGGALAVVALATLHNVAASGAFVLTTDNAGQNFYIGQQAKNTLGVYTPPPFVRPDPRFEEADFRAEAERRAGTALAPAAVSSFWMRQGLAAIGDDPAAAAARTLRKLLLFWHQYETPDNDNIAVLADVSPVLHLPVLWMGLLAPLALLGAVVGWRRRAVRVLTATALLYCAAVVAFFVLARFRAPLVPLLAVLAAGGIGWLRATAAAGDWNRAGLAAAATAAVALLLIHDPAWLAGVRRSSLAIAYHNYGTARAEAGDTDAAIAAYERAVAIDADAVPASLRALGDIYLERRQYDRAEAAMRRVLALRPDSRLAQEALARLERARAGGPASPAAAPPAAATPGGPTVGELYQKVRALRAEQRWPEAIAALEEAIRIGPYNEDAHYLLGTLMEQHAPPDEMVRYWQAAVATDPKPQTAYYYWAVGLERGGDLDGAIAQLRQALEVDPAHEMSELRWAQILEKQGRLDEALAHCQTATTIFPDFRIAHQTCARILRAQGREAEAAAADARARASDPNTPRRFVYWARYLQSKGRTAAAVAELERALRIDPADAEARALLAQIRPAATTDSGGALAAPARAALVAALRAQPAGAPVWFAVQDGDAGARALAAEVRAAFAEAGWTVRGQRRVPFAMKPGVYLFAADAAPPPYVETARAALEAAGLSPVFGSDYRAYYEERARTNPNFGGFRLDEEQSYLIVIGRRPS